MFIDRFLKNSTDPVYSVGQINSYPTTTYAVQVVTTLAYACKPFSKLADGAEANLR
jgi:hypothetical protein